MFHPSEPPPVPQGRRSSASASYHVGLDTMMGRRSRHRPEEVAIDGFLLLDTGEYELVTAQIPLDVFWKMKALDIVGQVRTANRARALRPSAYSHVGSVWLVDGDLEPPDDRSAGSEEDTRARRPTVAQNFFRSRTTSLRASRTASRARRRRSGQEGIPAAGSCGLLPRSGGHRTESPALSRPARAGHASGVPDGLSPDERKGKSPAVAGFSR